jgi:chorismate-pyruvate lyase
MGYCAHNTTFSSPIWKPSYCYNGTEITGKLKDWLLDPGSFTKKALILQRLTEALSIKVLHEGLELAQEATMASIHLPCRYVYVRETQIYLGNSLLMYAKSMMPKTTNVVLKSRFRGLAQKPLGKLLFSVQKIKRTPFELARILPSFCEFNLAVGDEETAPLFLWGRRSLFISDKPLVLLTEIFSKHLLGRINESG